MTRQKDTIFYRFWDAERGPLGLLMVTVLTVFVISPLVVMGSIAPLVVDLFFVIIMLAGVLTVHPRPVLRHLVLTLAVLAVLIRVPSKIIPGATITIVEAVIDIAAIGLFASLVMKQFVAAGRPSSHRIGAAIVVYLFMGLLWARLYEIAGLAIPGAFSLLEGNARLTSYLYFSFVTLTTTGYGDISPVHPAVRNLAVLEAISGQLYIAILIARLVSASDAKSRTG